MKKNNTISIDEAYGIAERLIKEGKLAKADQILTAVNRNTSQPRTYKLLGDIADKLNKSIVALAYYEKSVRLKNASRDHWLNLLKYCEIKSYDVKLSEYSQLLGNQNYKLTEYENKLRTLIRPEHIRKAPTAEYNKFINKYRKNKSASVKLLLKLRKKYPFDARLTRDLGTYFLEIEDYKQSLEYFEQAHKINPTDTTVLNNLGVLFELIADDQRSIYFNSLSIQIEPQKFRSFFNLANLYKKQKKFELAKLLYEKADQLEPKNCAIKNNLGLIYRELDELPLSIKVFQRVLELEPNMHEAHNNLAMSCAALGNIEKAIIGYRTALHINPNFPAAHNNLANALKNAGEFEKAHYHFKRAIELKPDYAAAYRNWSSILDFNKYPQLENDILKLTLKPNLSLDDLSCLNFSLFKAYEQKKQYDEAFKYLRAGNAARKKSLNYDIKNDIALFERLKVLHSTLRDISLTDVSFDGVQPIFIVGMPRSGTTLVEQIISSHPNVSAAGELPFVNNYGRAMINGSKLINATEVKRFRRLYLAKLTERSNGFKIVTDKMPHNFRYLSLIRAAFPEARVVHVVRNRAATCWSNYKHYFRANGLGYCYDLSDLREHYALYLDLMNFWELNLNLVITQCNYDNLVNHPELNIRNLISALGLDWSQDCLSPEKNKRSVRTASELQVKEKIYTGSSDKWKKYKKHLTELTGLE